MVFKVVAFCTLLAFARTIHVSPAFYATSPVIKYVNPAIDAVAATQQNVVRSFGATVASHSKSVATPYFSVTKEENRISNKVYTPSNPNNVTYAAPTVAKTYTAPSTAKAVTYTAPAVDKQFTHTSPVVDKPVEHFATAPTFTVSEPVYSKTFVASTAVSVNTHAAPAPVAYSHAAPVIKQAVAYSPATSVSHVSFEGHGAHWGY